MKWWNLIFNIASALGSIGTFLTFLFLFFDKKKEYVKIQNEKKLALDKLNICKREIQSLLNDEYLKEDIIDQCNEIILTLSEILGYKVIGDDICSSFSTYRYRISKAIDEIHNSDFDLPQNMNFDLMLSALESHVDLAISRLQKE